MESVVSVAATVLPLWQQRRQHDEALKLSNELHRQVIELNQTFHKEEMELNESLFARDCALERELHYGQLSHDFDIARREGVRDAWSQRSQLLQTLMVVDTLMYSCAFALLVQGDPPTSTSLWLLRAYAAALGTSMSLLFASVWCSLKLQARLSYYNMHRQDVVYVCGRQHRYFGDYFKCHCKGLSTAAFVCFYVGTVTTIVSAALYAFSKSYYEFGNVAAGVIFICFSVVAISIPLVSGLLDAWWRAPAVDAMDETYLEKAHKHAVQEVIRADTELASAAHAASTVSDEQFTSSSVTTPTENGEQ